MNLSYFLILLVFINFLIGVYFLLSVIGKKEENRTENIFTHINKFLDLKL